MGIVNVVAGYILAQDPGNDLTCIVTISKNLIAGSYKGNPSLLATKVLARLKRDNSEWESCSGHLFSDTQIAIRLSKETKQRVRIEGNVRPSVKGTIKNWVSLCETKSSRLKIPIAIIPAWYVSHPEQLIYSIKQETGVALKIVKLTGSWLFSRK